MWGYHDVTDTSDAAMEPPVCWITNAFDRSPAELVRVESSNPAWGPLQGSLLNLSYGNGKVFVVPHEIVGGQMQGGMCALPIPPFPTGIMRGRFHPADGQLYTCGLFAWAGDRTQPGGFYRIRATGKPMFVPIGLHARKDGMAITFTGRLDRKAASDPTHYAAKTWSLKRTVNYGSDHIDEQPARITAREGLRRWPHGLPRDPRHAADLVHGDHLRDPRRVGRGRRGRHRQHDPPTGRLMDREERTMRRLHAGIPLIENASILTPTGGFLAAGYTHTINVVPGVRLRRLAVRDSIATPSTTDGSPRAGPGASTAPSVRSARRTAATTTGSSGRGAASPARSRST